MKTISLADLELYLISEGYMQEEIIEPVKPHHGSCCACQECGQYHDECVCESNRWHQFLKEHTRG